MNNKPKVIGEEAGLLPSNAEALIARAIDKGVAVDTMERLLAMRRELKAEWAKEEFDRAMAAFQAKCPTIQKTKQAYNYKYAPLESIVEQVKDLLSENGFSYTFDTEEEENAIVVRCLVKHIAGHSEISKTTIQRETTTKMNASQQSGAAMTYGKRYAFCNAFGILTGDEDNDASSHVVETPKIQHATPDASANTTYQNGNGEVGTITWRQITTVKDLLRLKGYTEKQLEEKYEVTSIAQLTKEQASTVIENLNKLPDKA